MVKKRLIPKLQMKSVRFGSCCHMVLVTTLQFGRTVEVGSPISQAKIYQAQLADELIFLDLEATTEQRSATVEVIRQASKEIFMPLTAGGGIRNTDDILVMLKNGADKVSINSAALRRPRFIDEAASTFGSQCVVVSIDYRRNPNGDTLVFSDRGKCATGRGVVEWALEAERRGAGEILLTSIDRDGSQRGLDVQATSEVAEAVGIPVITSGGCGRATHFVEALRIEGVDAVAAGTFFCANDQNPIQTRAQISNAGLQIRTDT
jgi:cyclase